MAKDEELKEDEQTEEEEDQEESSSSDAAAAEEAPAEPEKEEEEQAEGTEEEESKDEEDKKEEDKKEEDKKEEDKEETYAAPTQLGHKRFVYAAYLAGGIVIAFVMTKLIDLGWLRLEQWKPSFGEPKEELIAIGSVVIAALITLRYWRDQKVRKLAEEVAEELTKVTWPTRKEVTNSTTVVIVATMFATIFFFLMDKFWSFVTNLVYGS